MFRNVSAKQSVPPYNCLLGYEIFIVVRVFVVHWGRGRRLNHYEVFHASSEKMLEVRLKSVVAQHLCEFSEKSLFPRQATCAAVYMGVVLIVLLASWAVMGTGRIVAMLDFSDGKFAIA